MDRKLSFEIAAQPNDVTCGPTCLQAVYRYHGVEVSLERIIERIPMLEGGGTLGVTLGIDALANGFQATLYTYNLLLFDPTWADLPAAELTDRLEAQARAKEDAKLRAATRHYVDFITQGGRVVFEDLSPQLIRGFLDRSLPILTGLSATYLYRTAREYGPDDDFDDIRGEPSGHFVVICGYDLESERVLIADPHGPNPISDKRLYDVSLDRVVAAILLGIITYDANLLILEPDPER